ncbi:MAG: hypothetical protein K1X64_00815 [Myxococcaceae bacterium]|nr:hypothetical protein [Myxococcaceae bacterium]
MTTLPMASALCLLLAAGQMQDDLAEAENLLQAFKYEKAVVVLSQALSRSDSTGAERAKAYALIGVGYFQMDDERQARAAFKEAVVLNKDVTLPPLTSPKITRVFERIKSETLPKPRLVEPRPQVGNADAGTQVAVFSTDAGIPGPLPQAEHSYIPLVVGSAVAAAAAGTAVYFGMTARSKEEESRRQEWVDDSQAVYRQAQDNATAAYALIGVAAGSLAAGVVVTFAF